MIRLDSFPKSYRAYERLEVCSNMLIGGGLLVRLGDVAPILIGVGERPQIWLQSPTNSKLESFVSFVEASLPTHRAARVLDENGDLKVFVGATLVLTVNQVDPSFAKVSSIDLRPVGLNIFGNAEGLTAGGTNFSGNVFEGIGTLIAFDR